MWPQALTNWQNYIVSQEKYEEALPLFQRALTILEKAYGSNNRDVVTVLNQMANLLHAQNKYEEAIPLYRRATGDS